MHSSPAEVLQVLRRHHSHCAFPMAVSHLLLRHFRRKLRTQKNCIARPPCWGHRPSHKSNRWMNVVHKAHKTWMQWSGLLLDRANVGAAAHSACACHAAGRILVVKTEILCGMHAPHPYQACHVVGEKCLLSAGYLCGSLKF